MSFNLLFRHLSAAAVAGVASVALVSMGSASAATTIFDGGAPDGIGINQVTEWVQAEDFILTQALGTILTGATFWTLENPDLWDGVLDYYVFNDAGGQPASSPLVQGSGVNVTKTATGNFPLAFTEYVYSFDLEAPLILSADTTYWLGLHLASNVDNVQIYWETTAVVFGSAGQESQSGTFTHWSNTNQQHAFFLKGVPVPGPLPVLGAAAAYGWSRRLRHRLATSRHGAGRS